MNKASADKKVQKVIGKNKPSGRGRGRGRGRGSAKAKAKPASGVEGPEEEHGEDPEHETEEDDDTVEPEAATSSKPSATAKGGVKSGDTKNGDSGNLPDLMKERWEAVEPWMYSNSFWFNDTNKSIRDFSVSFILYPDEF